MRVVGSKRARYVRDSKWFALSDLEKGLWEDRNQHYLQLWRAAA
jgi:hypothetical protein